MTDYYDTYGDESEYFDLVYTLPVLDAPLKPSFHAGEQEGEYQPNHIDSSPLDYSRRENLSDGSTPSSANGISGDIGVNFLGQERYLRVGKRDSATSIPADTFNILEEKNNG